MIINNDVKIYNDIQKFSDLHPNIALERGLSSFLYLNILNNRLF